MNDLGAWKVHPLVRLPFHGSHCQTCEGYRHHVIAMDKESADGVAGDMARLWGSQEVGELRRENNQLKEERDGARADVEELKRQVEELKRSVENTGGQLPVGSRALGIGETEQEERGASPGTTEVALVRPSSDGIVITQDLPGTVLQFTLPDE